MKAQMKKLIDVDDLIDRLETNNVPYCGKIENIIATMPQFTMYNIKPDDYPENGNGDFRFEIAPCEDSCDAPYDVPCNYESNDTEEVPAYVNRMIHEYHELKDKYNKLHSMLVKHEAGTLDFEPTCPIELLERQANVMSEYLHTLEVRAEIENVEL